MKRRILSIICLVLLLITTTYIPFNINSGNFVYSITNNLTDEEKQNIAFATYMNSRGGYFKGASSGAVIAVMKNYINEFYTSDANDTDINSLRELASKVSVSVNNGNFSVQLEPEAITFLNHLVLWLLGKDEFPNLYAGGAWGNDANTSDLAYTGLSVGGSLYTIVNSDIPKQANAYVNNISSSSITLGSPYNGYSTNFFIDYFNTKNNVTINYGSLNQPSLSTQAITLTGPKATENGSNITANYVLSLYTASALGDMVPVLGFSLNTSNPLEKKIFSSRLINVDGFVGMCEIRPSNNPPYHAFCVISHNANNGLYCVSNIQIYSNPVYNATNMNINFDTEQFQKFDEEDSVPITYTPKYKDGDTYNYFNEENYNTYNDFYNDYNNYYRQEKTIIYEKVGDNPTNPDPDLPVAGEGGSGTITPNGSGGFNFNLPDFDLPDLSGLNWSISGLSEKFPFSIPFDLIAFFTVLNAEPETPELQGNIDLGLVQWNIDWDLHDFDNLASILRNLEFIGFCIALIIITRGMIKG